MSLSEEQLKTILGEFASPSKPQGPVLVSSDPYSVFIWTINVIHLLINEDNHRFNSKVSWSNLTGFKNYTPANRNLYRFCQGLIQDEPLKVWMQNKMIGGTSTVKGFFRELLEYVGLNEGSLLRELHSITQQEGEKLRHYHTRFENIVNVLQRIFDSDALTHTLKFELFQRGVHPQYKQYLWTANSNIESWLDQAKKLERFASDVRLNAPTPPPNEAPNANYMQMFSSVEPMFAGFSGTSSLSQKLDSLINRLDERGYLEVDPAEKRPFSENNTKDFRPNKRSNTTGFVYAKKSPTHANDQGKKFVGKSTKFSPSSFAKSTIKKMRITAPAYFVLKGILDEIDSSIWSRVEKVFQRESQVSAMDVDASIIVEDDNDIDNDWNEECNIVETKLTPSELPLEFYPHLQEIMVTEPSGSEIVKDEGVEISEDVNGEVNFDEGKTFSSCCFKKVQISTPRGTSPRNIILKNTRKVLLDSGAATSLISVDLVEKLRMRESINSQEKGCFINANGKSFHTLGKVNIPLSIFPTLEANKPIPFGRTSFHVLDRGDSKIILGMDWLYKNKVTLDTSSQRISVISPYGFVRHLDISYVVKGPHAFNALDNQGISWTGNYWKLYNSKKEGMYDVRCMKNITIPPSQDEAFKLTTDLKLTLPKCMFCEVKAPKNNSNYSLKISGGIIDEDYKGSIGLVVSNPTNRPIHINNGRVVCHLIFKRIQDAIEIADYECEDTKQVKQSESLSFDPGKFERLETLCASLIERLSFLEEQMPFLGEEKLQAFPQI